MEFNESKFDAQKLRVNLEGNQKGPILDKQKARVMAETEDTEREFAEQYKRYSEDPGVFIGQHPDLPMQEIVVLEALHKNKVPPEYILRLAEIGAEVGGELHDFKKKIRGYTSVSLREMADVLERRLETSQEGENVLESDSGTLYDRTPIGANYGLRHTRDILKYRLIEKEIERRDEQD